jgi:hypothetical protein
MEQIEKKTKKMDAYSILLEKISKDKKKISLVGRTYSTFTQYTKVLLETNNMDLKIKRHYLELLFYEFKLKIDFFPLLTKEEKGYFQNALKKHHKIIYGYMHMDGC